MNCQVSTMIDLPEAQHNALQNWLDRHPRISQSEAISYAVSLFLLQNGERSAAKDYLSCLFSDNEVSL